MHLKTLIDAYGQACRRDGSPAWESAEGKALAHALAAPALPRMTAPEIEEMMNNMAIYDGDYETAIVRATEKHHGIGL